MNKKKTILRIIFLILLLITFTVIFKFSSQIAQESDNISYGVLGKILDIFPYTKGLNEGIKLKIIEHGNVIIRKLAHFSIYSLVGVWIMSYMSTFNTRLYKKWIISMAVGVLYAVSDEFHQSFVPGRSPSIIDVGIDSLGVITGIFIVLIIISIYRALKSDKKSEKEC